MFNQTGFIENQGLACGKSSLSKISSFIKPCFVFTSSSNMKTAYEGGLCVCILCHCKTINPPKQMLYFCYTSALISVMHNYMVKKCCTCFAIFVFGV